MALFLIHIPHFSSSELVVDLYVYFHGEHQTSYLHIMFEPTSDIHCSSQLCQRHRHDYHPHREICHASGLSPQLSCRQHIGSLEWATWQHLLHLFRAMSWPQEVNLQCLLRIHQGRSDIGSNCNQVRHKEQAVQVQWTVIFFPRPDQWKINPNAINIRHQKLCRLPERSSSNISFEALIWLFQRL